LIKVEGVSETVNNIRLFRENLGKEVAEAVLKSALAVRDDAVRSIQTKTGGGRTYRLYKPNRTHQASAPNNAPNTDTGRLVSSIKWEVQKDAVIVGSGLKYARYLEFGTRNVQPRPWLIPAFEKNRNKIRDLIQEAKRKEIAKL